jgi:lipopolysaccharide/colanic/teichoic acid biosynthesis glycosyltransferase
MSIVGPRPHPLGCRAEDKLFWAIDERYFDRHAIKPGMTGLAQVRGFRGATEKLSDLADRLRADLEYLDDWHIGRDVGIMFRTLGVLVHPNAF